MRVAAKEVAGALTAIGSVLYHICVEWDFLPEGLPRTKDRGECCAPFILKNYHKHTLEYSGTNFGRFWNFWFWVKIWLMTDRKYPAIEHRHFTVLGYASTNLHHQISKNSTFKAKWTLEINFVANKTLHECLFIPHLRWMGFSARRAPQDKGQRRVLRTTFVQGLVS